MDVMDLGHRSFMVKLDSEKDRTKVMEGGPWMIYDNCLAVRRWTPEYHPEYMKIDRTIVWFRLPGLNLTYYDESFLMAMASANGTPIRVDRNTFRVARGRFAQVCVEIELQKPAIGKCGLMVTGTKLSMRVSTISVQDVGSMGIFSITSLTKKSR